MIYLIAARCAGLAKVGSTSNIKKRLASIQTGCPYDLAIIATRDGGPALEKAIHSAASCLALRGEWFYFNDDLVRIFHGTKLVSLIEALGGTSAVAEALGVNANVVANWHKRPIPWSRRHAIAQLAQAKGVDLPTDFLGIAA